MSLHLQSEHILKVELYVQLLYNLFFTALSPGMKATFKKYY